MCFYLPAKKSIGVNISHGKTWIPKSWAHAYADMNCGDFGLHIVNMSWVILYWYKKEKFDSKR